MLHLQSGMRHYRTLCPAPIQLRLPYRISHRFNGDLTMIVPLFNDSFAVE